MNTKVTFDLLREVAMRKDGDHPSYEHMIPVIDAIEQRAAENGEYAKHVENWLDGTIKATVFTRDTICEAVKANEAVIKVGWQFYPGTEWHNIWIAIDNLMHITRLEEEHPERVAEVHYQSNPIYGTF